MTGRDHNSLPASRSGLSRLYECIGRPGGAGSHSRFRSRCHRKTYLRLQRPQKLSRRRLPRWPDDRPHTTGWQAIEAQCLFARPDLCRERDHGPHFGTRTAHRAGQSASADMPPEIGRTRMSFSHHPGLRGPCNFLSGVAFGSPAFAGFLGLKGCCGDENAIRCGPHTRISLSSIGATNVAFRPIVQNIGDLR